MLLSMLQRLAGQDGEGGPHGRLLARDAEGRRARSARPRRCTRRRTRRRSTSDEAERLHKALGEVKLMAPPASCVVPIGEDAARRGAQAPLQGGVLRLDDAPAGRLPRQPVRRRGGARVRRRAAARRAGGDPAPREPRPAAVPAQGVRDQRGGLRDELGKSYELAQPKGSLPVAPLAIVVHLASVWVPFTSEAKEAVAHYDELMKELKLAIQECGRKLGAHLRAREKALSEQQAAVALPALHPRGQPRRSRTSSASPKAKVRAGVHDALPNFVNDRRRDGQRRRAGVGPPPRRRAAAALDSMPAPAAPPPRASEARRRRRSARQAAKERRRKTAKKARRQEATACSSS